MKSLICPIHSKKKTAPVNCIGSWQPTGPCSATCGQGQQPFTFVVTQQAQNGGAQCVTLDGNTKVDSCKVPLPSCGMLFVCVALFSLFQ